MKRRNKSMIACAILFVWLSSEFSVDNAKAQATQEVPPSATVTKSVTAIGYEVGGGSTKVDLKGTELMPQARGEAKVEIKSNAGRTRVDIEVKAMKPPSTLGAEILTYVLWVVTPEGRTGNTGEILVNKNGDGKLSATTPVQTFTLIITAEPYFAVRVPSELVVLQSERRKDTKGKIFPVTEYKLIRRGQYQKMGNPLALTLDPNVPLEMYEARNAVDIAKSRGADKYAGDIFSKAGASLEMAEKSLATKADRNSVISLARQVRTILDQAGLENAKIMASGDLGEYKIRDIIASGAPVDSFGVGTELATSADAPSMGTVYKLVEVDICGIKRFTAKFSEDKETLPGAKQVFRLPDRDVLARAAECCAGSEALLRPVILGGQLVEELPGVNAARARAFQSIARLPAELRGLDPAAPRLVEYSKDLAALIERTRRNQA